MKIGPVSLSGVSIAVLAIQLAIVSSIAAKYLYERASCPRVWTKTAAYAPDLFMRGRYLGLRLTADGCKAGLPLNVGPEFTAEAPVRLAVESNRLVAYQLPQHPYSTSDQRIFLRPGRPCDAMILEQPVNFYIGEHAQSPLPVKSGDELWIEVILPPKGPPRALQLALKHEGVWQPLTYR
jgi:hypothetical protein